MIKLLCPRGEQTSSITIILFSRNSKLNDSSHHNTDRSELLRANVDAPSRRIALLQRTEIIQTSLKPIENIRNTQKCGVAFLNLYFKLACLWS